MKIIMVAFALFLVGCSSIGGGDNVRQYYLLEPSIEAKNSRIDGEPLMSIRRVRLPDYIGENKGLVRRDGTGKIRISTLHNWAEHLSTTVPNVLAMELSTQLKQPVDLHPIPAGFDIPFILEVDILNMLGGPKSNAEGGKAEFEFQAKYRIIGRDSLKSYRFNETFTLENDQAETVVDAYSTAIQALTQDIAKKLK